MGGQIVGLSVDKVQTFLTEAIHSHVQEKEAEEATLRSIMWSSRQISEDFFESIQNKFGGLKQETLLECSGVYIFRSTALESELKEKLNELFAEYYRESQGQKLLRWVCFRDPEKGNLKAVKEAKKQLKNPKKWSRIIEENRELLFSFSAVPKENRKKVKVENFAQFADTINALGDTQTQSRFRIAVIKADLDGMGRRFEKIQDYSQYMQVSKILNEEISLSGLHQAAKDCRRSEASKWIFPFYAAGDDIFFAVAIEHLIAGIDVCRKMLRAVNRRLSKVGIKTGFTLSVGVEVTYNREPVRYYMNRVEEQLKIAKTDKTAKAGSSETKIAIGNLRFLAGTAGGGSRYSWNRFVRDVELLSYIKSDESGCSEQLGKPHFFYTMLQELAQEEIRGNEIRYTNHLLYCLMPEFLESSDQKLRCMELFLKKSLIEKLYQKQKNKYIFQPQENRRFFERYMRLLMLFSDGRFKISAGKRKEPYQRPEEKEIKQLLLKQPREYLYEKCLKRTAPKLTDLFIRKEGDRYYKIFLEPSMLFRMKNVERIPAAKAVEMIGLRNPQKEQKLEGEKEQRKIVFDRDVFFRAMTETGEWTPDFVETLLLFYYYDRLTKIYKPVKKEKSSENGKEPNNKSKDQVKPLYRRNAKNV